ncbi:hypothetical protein [Microbacterium sp.]|uniref:hypothetical protein n=1 Tax=Microbacterium sp. TaxID=51671 RepID=UPI0028114479|nr:hypothetical protein [Microbacterium sp.]
MNLSSRAARRTPTRALVAALALALAAGLGGCTTAAPAPSPEPTSADPAELLLIGMRGFAMEDLGLDLEDLGYNVADAGEGVTSTTDLVLVVVSGVDGPLPPTREAVAGLAGSVVPRVAVAVTDVDEQDDPEIITFVVRETVELLASYGIAPVDAENPVLSPSGDIRATIDRHLRRAPRDYRPMAPEPPSPPEGPAMVDNLAGVPMNDALSILTEKGLVGEVLADPDLGVVSDCNPPVQGQAPAAGTTLPVGSIVGLLVPPPDRADPAMAGCLLPERTRAQIDERLAAIDAQPTG